MTGDSRYCAKCSSYQGLVTDIKRGLCKRNGGKTAADGICSAFTPCRVRDFMKGLRRRKE